jgi:proteasome lid subunit RPN8/RPN11
MLFNQMRICVPRKVTQDFLRRAKAAFPNETLGYLIGRTDENMTLRVEEIFYPSDLEQHQQKDAVQVQWRWFREARRRAKQLKATVLGDLHSHPYTSEEILVWKRSPDCSPSEGDLERTKPGLIMGICLIKQSANGALRTRLKYWGPTIRVAEVVKSIEP